MNKFMKRLMSKKDGFTLVELIVVIAILAILAGIAVPAYTGYIKKANDAAVLTELDALQTAVQAANATTGSVTKIVVGSSGTTVTLTGTLGTNFLTDFQTFYNDSTATISNQVLTLSSPITFSKTSYEGKGATWENNTWSVTSGS